MAPESLSKKVYSNKSDVWSYGVVVFECIQREEPFKDLTTFDAGCKIVYEGKNDFFQ